MDWKRNFLESSLLRRSTNKNNPNEVQAKCVDLAYKDMMTAGRYYSALFLHTQEKICRDTNEAIKQCDYVFSRDLIQKTSLLFCKDIKDIIGSGNKYVTGYGLAQKLINMTFKYLYVFSDLIFIDKPIPDFSSCDCPLDSIILNGIPYNKTVWSKFTKADYIKCQNKISDLLKSMTLDDELKSLGNMAYDFLNW